MISAHDGPLRDACRSIAALDGSPPGNQWPPINQRLAGVEPARRTSNASGPLIANRLTSRRQTAELVRGSREGTQQLPVS